VRFAFRVDASLQAGTGHVMRCLTLADELHRRGADASFLCREEPGNLIALITSRGYPAEILAAASPLGQQSDAQACAGPLMQRRPDWIVVDHYGLGKQWEAAVRPHARAILVIDDLADRDHECDLLLDQNLYDGVEHRYGSRVPSQCRQLIGPSFALLRPEFARLRSHVSRQARAVSRLLVNFGGADSSNETARILAILQELLPLAIGIDVVLGATNPHAGHIRSLATARPATAMHVATDRMADLMAQADAFVGAGGSTTWERFCLGLPSLVLAVADNQVPTAEYLGKLGAIDYIGTAAALTADGLRTSLSRFLIDHDRRARMAELGMQLVDGRGVERVSDCLLNFGNA
jgi:UDP-2,4-diacetamido-2,4,6-trideoxy-beta-L-altropyranose hydrolase